MRSTYSILPYINRNKVKADGTTSVLCRITIDGKSSKMATGIASGAAGNMGLFVFSKLRKVDEADRGKLTVVQFENDVDGFSGFMYPSAPTPARCSSTIC